MKKQRLLPAVFISLFALVVAIHALAVSEAAKVDPESAKLAPDLPIADLHLHPQSDIPASEIKDRMDANGVRWAGAGARRMDRSAWMVVAKELGGRFIAFAGQTELIRVYFEGGVPAMEDANNRFVRDLLRSAEEDLKAGRIKGIGEIFVNNSGSTPRADFRHKARTDAPSIRLLYGLVAKYDAFLTLHMEADADSVEQLERVLESDRRGRILLNHCGVGASAAQVRSVLERHPNLFCELSLRYPPVLRGRLMERFPEAQIFSARGPDSDWLQLIEDFPDRFMIGTDAKNRSQYDESIQTVRKGLLPYLSPATARKVAYENAQRLFGLK